MKNKFLILSLTIFLFAGCAQQNGKLITSFGAIPDGKTNNAAFIQKAIDAVSEAGGGQVLVPPGNFRTGTIYLKSGVDLHLEAGACLQGTANRADYTDDKRSGLIEAKKQTRISISGPGVIDGEAHELMLDIFKKLRSGEMKQDSIWMYKRPEGGRTVILSIDDCNDVRISGITLQNSSGWVQNYTACTNVIINGITVQSTAYWNNDGLDISDCKHVKITNCFINSADDGICLKSGDFRSCCDDVFVDSCTVRSSASGFKMGTGSTGGFKNVKVRNLTVFDTYRSAIAIESVDGGVIENIDIQNVVAKNTGNAIFIRLGHRNKGDNFGSIKGVYIANVKAETPLLKPDQGYPIEGPPDHLQPGVDKMPSRPSNFHIYGHPFLPYNLIPSSIVGIPGHPVQDVTIENVEISYGGQANKTIAFMPLREITAIPEHEAKYPEFSMFGELPSWGFYVRHAEGIKMKNVRVWYKKEDFRPAFVFDDVKGIGLTDVNIAAVKELPAIYFNNTTGIDIKNLKMPVPGSTGVVMNRTSGKLFPELNK